MCTQRCRDAITVTWKMHHLRHFSGGLVQTFNENFIVNTKNHAYTRCRGAITVTWKVHHLRHFSGGLVQTFNENYRQH